MQTNGLYLVRTPILLLATTALLALLTGCSGGSPLPYALAYEEALERYPGSADTDPGAVDQFVEFFSSDASHGGDPASLAENLYADRLYFSDTLLTSQSKAEVVQHLTRMHEATSSLSVRVLHRQQDGADFYIIWRMTAKFAPVSTTITGHSIGMTHLRFDPEGRIVLQQDFWDASAGFYEHLPVIGFAIRTIQGSFHE